MSASARLAQDVLVPRHVSALADLAMRHGIEVGSYQHQQVSGEDWEDTRLTTTWRGTGQQFGNTGLFSLTQRRDLESPYPIGNKVLSLPDGHSDWRHRCYFGSIAIGRMTKPNELVEWTIDFGSAPNSIRLEGEVEIHRAGDAEVQHGSAEALVASGIQGKRLPTGRRTAKSGYSQVVVHKDGHVLWKARRWWTSRRYFDGMFVYREELASVYAARSAEMDRYERSRTHKTPASPEAISKLPKAKGAFLRLVVDNTVR